MANTGEAGASAQKRSENSLVELEISMQINCWASQCSSDLVDFQFSMFDVSSIFDFRFSHSMFDVWKSTNIDDNRRNSTKIKLVGLNVQ